jgi:hypothetical protein
LAGKRINNDFPKNFKRGKKLPRREEEEEWED